jgi:hypothetical protein
MLSYTGRRNLFGTLTNNTTSGNLTTGDTLMNTADKRILTMRQWPFLERKDTSLTTTASQQAYEIPQRVGKAQAFTITVSSQIYTPREITSEQEWQRLNRTSVTSDSVEFFYIRGSKVEFYPKPASSSNTITVYGRAVPKDLSIADYTTGGVLTATNGSTAIVGTGTTWAVSMAGRYLRITESDTANKGDGQWYEISSSGSTTTITLVKSYAGTSISAGNAAYTIGQMALYLEGYHELPVYDAARTYFSSIQPDVAKYKMYDTMYKEMLGQLISDWSNPSGGVVLDDGNGYEVINPNLTISL